MTKKPPALLKSALLFVAAYALTNVVNSAVTLAYQSIVRLPSADEIGLTWLQDPAYQATVPWHALIVFLIFLGTASWLRLGPNDAPRAWRIGAAWCAVSVAIDAVVYVLILGSTRWGLPAFDYYIGNQPWITLSYLGVLIAPVVARAIHVSRRGAGAYT